MQIGHFETASRITQLDGQLPELQIVEASQVCEGVFCWAFSIPGDETKDLGIVTVLAGHSTPLQKVLEGDRTEVCWPPYQEGRFENLD